MAMNIYLTSVDTKGKLSSSVSPSSDNDLSTKKYVDDNSGGGGSSSDTFSIDHFGRFKWVNDNLMGHSTYAENSRYSLILTTLSGKATYSDGTPDLSLIHI